MRQHEKRTSSAQQGVTQFVIRVRHVCGFASIGCLMTPRLSNQSVNPRRFPQALKHDARAADPWGPATPWSNLATSRFRGTKNRIRGCLSFDACEWCCCHCVFDEPGAEPHSGYTRGGFHIPQTHDTRTAEQSRPTPAGNTCRHSPLPGRKRPHRFELDITYRSVGFFSWRARWTHGRSTWRANPRRFRQSSATCQPGAITPQTGTRAQSADPIFVSH